MAELERFELRRRADDAARLRIIGELVAEVTEMHPVPPLDGQDPDAPAMKAPDELAQRSLRAELALLLQISEYRAKKLMDLAYRAAHDYPRALALVASGELTVEHVEVIAEAGLVIGMGDAPDTQDRRSAYEQRAIEAALVETPNGLRPIVKQLAEVWSEAPIEVRHENAAQLRRVTVIDAEDGMADLYAHLPAHEAYAIHDRLTRIARSAKNGERGVPAAGVEHGSGASGGSTGGLEGESAVRPADESAGEAGGAAREAAEEMPHASATEPEMRTRDQLRADAFVDLLLSSDPFALTSGCPAEAIHARIQLWAPIGAMETDQDSGDGTGELAGYGPIGIDRIRECAVEGAHFEKVAVSGTGGVLSVERYRPSEEMRRRLRARDRRCRFPGCRVPVHRCDLDHTVDAAGGGPTSTDNLGHLCRKHHTLKHHSDWSVEQDIDGVFRWTSPTGRTHLDVPPGKHGAPVQRRRSKPSRRPADEGRTPPRRASRVRFEPVHQF